MDAEREREEQARYGRPRGKFQGRGDSDRGFNKRRDDGPRGNFRKDDGPRGKFRGEGGKQFGDKNGPRDGAGPSRSFRDKKK